MSYPPPPPPDNSNTLKSINWGVWILVFVFVILPVGIGLCCCVGPMVLGMFGMAVEGVTETGP